MIKYELEYPIKSSLSILFDRLSTLSGLSEWFADDVNLSRDGLYIFTWEGSQQSAKLLSKKKINIFVSNGMVQQMNFLNLEFKSMN